MGIKSKVLVTVIIVVAICVTSIFGVLLVSYLNGEPSVTVMNGKVVISGQYEESITLSEAEVTYVSTPLEITMRVNGFSQDNTMRGNYNISAYPKTAYCSIENKTEPYILLVANDNYYLINLETKENTKALYEKIKSSK